MKLYAPPREVVQARRAAGRPMGGMDVAAARALAAQVAAEDARLTRG